MTKGIPITDRDLVRLHWPANLRNGFDALFAIDDALADVVATATQPALAAIKLAWWREALERLDQGLVPAEPRLQSAASELLSRGLAGSDIATLEDGWAAMLEETPDAARALERGERLFALGARLLGESMDAQLAEAGRVFAAGSLKRRGFTVSAGAIPTGLSRMSRPLRPLTILSALALRDLRTAEAEATPARSWTILRHRLTGR